MQQGETWLEEAQLLASNGADGDEFGYSVAVWGETAVVATRNTILTRILLLNLHKNMRDPLGNHAYLHYNGTLLVKMNGSCL